MEIAAWDTWAFVETALGYRRKPEVAKLWQSMDVVVTARDIIGETYTFILGRTKNPDKARQWLEAATRSRVRIVDPPLEAVVDHIAAHPEAGPLSWPDMALAYVAEQAGARTIATEDQGFQRLAFETPFASGTG